MKARKARKARERQGDVAIIGMSGLFAKAPDVRTFWSNMLSKVDAIADAPSDWLVDRALLDPDSTEIGRIYTQRGGFLGELSRFDARAYGTMPNSVQGGEPDQFLALAAAADALKDAGYPAGSFDSSRTGIILGHAIHANRANVNGNQHSVVLDQMIGLFRSLFPEAADSDLEKARAMLRSRLPLINLDAAPGLVPNMMTGRIANRLDLMGPNYIIDAACASSLIAVDLAMSELRDGRADLMLAGASNTTTSPLVYMVFCQLGALSRGSRIRPFGKAADGTLLGEGQGIFVLKRLEDALADGDRIYAVAKGVGRSSDGRGAGLMAPRLEGEIVAMDRAYQAAGIDPATIGLLEAHGTGIPLGDHTEITAIHRVMGERRMAYPHIAMGSVKSMIGHCIPAAGSASIIKVAMALHTKTLPPSLCEEVDPDLGIERTPFYVNTEAIPWVHAAQHPRRAAINAFGFGGVNSHLILEEAPGSSDAVDPGAAFGLRASARSELFLFAAESRADLLTQLEACAAQAAAAVPLARLAADAFAGLTGGAHRLSIVADGCDDLAKKIGQARSKLADPDVHRLQTRNGVAFADTPLAGKIAFLFPGENSQYPGMLRDLALAFPAAREWLDFLDGLFGDEREVPHHLMLFPPPTCIAAEHRDELRDSLLRVDTGSEAVFCADQAIFSTLRSLGVRPDFLLGHSTGENAALVASGMLNFDRDQVRAYIVAMNRIFQQVEDDGGIPRGSLLSVGGLDRAQVLDLVERVEGLHFTMDNCPNQAVLYGPEETIARIAAELSAAGGICQRLPLSWAYHTPLLTPMAKAFGDLFSKITPVAPIAPVYSCVSAGPFPSDKEQIRRLAVDQYSNRVRFTDAVRALYDAGARIFLEVGPSGNLTAFVRDILQGQPHLALACDQRKANGLTQLQKVLGQLFIQQVPLDLAALFAGAPEPPAAKAEPYLPSALPYIRLDRQDAEELRRLLMPHDSEAAAANGAGAAPEAPQPAPAATAAPAANRPRRPGRPGGSPIRHVRLQDWTPYFDSPVPLGICVAGLPAGLNPGTAEGALRRVAQVILAPEEAALWQSEAVGRHPRRHAEWLLARIAAKSAARDWLFRQNGAFLPLRRIEILKAEGGLPWLRLRGIALGRPVHVSLAHADGVAVAGIASVPIGLDLELLDRVSDPEAIAGIAFEPELWDAVLRDNPGRAAQSAVVLWSYKEAAAKCLGEGLVGQERAFRVVDIAGDLASGTVVRNGAAIGIMARRFGPMICTLALARPGESGPVERNAEPSGRWAATERLA